MRGAVGGLTTVFLSLSSVLLVSCQAATPSPVDEGSRILVGQFVEPPISPPLVALEAHLGERDFFMRYRVGDRTFYSGGNWSDRISITGMPGVVAEDYNYTGPYILPLEYHSVEPPPDRPDNIRPVSILSISQWMLFRDRLLASVVTRDERAGVIVAFDVEDYFLYYDEHGDFRSEPLRNRPAGYIVKESIGFDEFLHRGVPVLEAFLADARITDRRIVFNTGDVGIYSLPFLYVNLDRRIAVFARYVPDRSTGLVTPPVVPLSQTLGHVLRSHSSALALRPVSSLYRLFFVLKDTAVETVRPTWLVNLADDPVPPVTGGPGMDLVEWEHHLDRITDRAGSRGTIEYLIDGEEFFGRLIASLQSAQKSIHMRTYIFDNDDYAAGIGELLKQRSKEGVDVRVLLDGLGTMVSTLETQQSLPQGHDAPLSVRQFLEDDSNVLVRQAPNPWLTGDHVKTTIVDEQIAFTGGMNIAREYRYDWHDLMVEVRGPVVDELSAAFDDAWARAGFFGDVGYFFHKLRPKQRATANDGYPIRVLHTRAGDSEIFAAQLAAIRRAQRYVYIENAYFTDDTMLYELAKARRRGVDVRVIIPLVTDRGPITRDNALAANAMLEHGIRVFIYPGMSHVKAAVYDGWICLGSANFDQLSFRINLEINLATSELAAVDGLIERVFTPDFEKSPELTEQFPERWSDHLLEIIGDYVF